MEMSKMNYLQSILLILKLILFAIICENGIFCETSSAMNFVPATHPSIVRFPEADSPYDGVMQDFRSVNFNENRTKIIVTARHYLIRLDLETFKLTNTSDNRNIFSVSVDKIWAKRCGGSHLVACSNFFGFAVYCNSSVILACGSYAERGRCWAVYAKNFTLKNDVKAAYGSDRVSLATQTPTGVTVGILTSNKAIVAGVESKRPRYSIQGFSPSGRQMSSKTSQNVFSDDSVKFISVHEGDDGFAYIFFTETAEEVTERKTVYSRVGRVCTWDKGPQYDDIDKYVTFRKSQIVCYKKGSVPDYYDHIQSTTAVKVHNSDGTTEIYIYASFTTTVRSTGSSAICRYRLKDIQKLFATSKYYVRKYNKDQTAFQYVVTDFPDRKVDFGRKTCNSSLNTEENINCGWGCTNPMFYDDAKPYDETAVMIFRGERITALALEDIHRDQSGNKTDVGKHVLFAGTDSGMIYKVVMNSTNVGEPVFLEKIQAVKKPGRISRLYFNKDYMIGLGPAIKLLKIKKERCETSYLLCSDCLKSRDPYCAWSISQKKCTRAQELPLSDRLQSIENGNDSICPPVDIHISCSLKIVDNVPGARTALLCSGNGIIRPKVIAWKKGSNILDINPIYQVKVINASTQMLIIRDYTTSDLGTYGCVVGAGRNKSHCSVSLKGTKPDVICNTTDMNCSCQVTGYPNPTIRKVINGNETIKVSQMGMFYLQSRVFVFAINSFGEAAFSCRVISKPATTSTTTAITTTTTATTTTTTTTKSTTNNPTTTMSTTQATTTEPSTTQTTPVKKSPITKAPKTEKSKETTKPVTAKKTPATPGKRVECPRKNEDKYLYAFIACLVLLIIALFLLFPSLYLLMLYRKESQYYDEEDEFDGRKGTLNVSKNHDTGPALAVELFQRKRNKIKKTDSNKPLVNNKKREPKNGCKENSPSKYKRDSYKTAKEMDDLVSAEDGRTIHT